MKTDKILNTGYNPNINSFAGTSNESFYYETTPLNDSLSSIIKNDQMIIEEPIYLASTFFIETTNLIMG